jgi:hypothetical protein
MAEGEILIFSGVGIFMYALFLDISSTSTGVNQPCGRVFREILFELFYLPSRSNCRLGGKMEKVV